VIPYDLDGYTAAGRVPFVRLSVSHDPVLYCIKTAQRVVDILSPPDSPNILLSTM